jgi:hypothetical protein
MFGAVLGLYCFSGFAYESLRGVGVDLFPVG